jgi:hypothetical protein
MLVFSALSLDDTHGAVEHDVVLVFPFLSYLPSFCRLCRPLGYMHADYPSPRTCLSAQPLPLSVGATVF